MRTRTRLIALAATFSLAAIAAASLAGASVPSGGGGIGGTVGAAGGGGGAHFSGGGGALSGGFRGGSFAPAGGGGFRGGGMAVGHMGGAGIAPHGFYAPARGYGMVGSQSAGPARTVAMRGGHEAANFAGIGPRFASATRAVVIARVPRVTLRVPAVRPGPRPPPAKRPAPKMQKLTLPSRAGSCEFDACGRQVFLQPFCIDLTAQQLADPHFVRGPFDCPQPVRARMR